MGKPAATLGCFYACPKVNPGPVPHVGGPVVQGSPNVLIGGMPAARKGDKIVCVGPPDTITEGSATVFINGKPAARMGDSTAHGGKIMVGNPSVIIGDGTYEYTYDEEFDDDDSSLFPDDYFDFLSGNGISSHETDKTKGHEEANTQKAKPEGSMLEGADVPNSVDSVAARHAHLKERFDRTGDLNLDINIRGRQEVATNFFRSQGIPEGKIDSFFTGIDFTQPVSVLRSRSAAVDDFWSVSGQSYSTTGGATQLFSPQKQSFILISDN